MFGEAKVASILGEQVFCAKVLYALLNLKKKKFCTGKYIKKSRLLDEFLHS